MPLSLNTRYDTSKSEIVMKVGIRIMMVVIFVMIASIPVFTDITGLNDVKAVNAYDSLKAPRPTGGFRK
jgi:hypothetical protein